MYIYLVLLYTSTYSVQCTVYSIQCTVYGSICTFTGTSLHIYVLCTVYGSICTFTWYFSTHLRTVYSVQYMVQYVHLPDTSLHIYILCTVYGSICTFTWYFSTHLCTVYSIWFNMYIYLALLYTSTYSVQYTVYSIWFNMYIYQVLLYTSTYSVQYSVQYMVQYVHLPGTSLHIYVQCTVYGSICTFTWHFSTHLCTSSTVAEVSLQQSAAHKCILLSSPRSLVLSISLMKS